MQHKDKYNTKSTNKCTFKLNKLILNIMLYRNSGANTIFHAYRTAERPDIGQQ